MREGIFRHYVTYEYDHGRIVEHKIKLQQQNEESENTRKIVMFDD